MLSSAMKTVIRWCSGLMLLCLLVVAVQCTPEPETYSETHEPTPLTDTSPTTEAEPQPLDPRGTKPEVAAKIVPSFLLMLAMFGGLACLVIATKYRPKTHERKRNENDVFEFMDRNDRSTARVHTPNPTETSTENVELGDVTKTGASDGAQDVTNEHEFFRESDIEIVDSLYTLEIQPTTLLVIMAPAMFSLVICPLMMVLNDEIIDMLWPPHISRSGQPDINTAVASFLFPAGMVYATSFGFSFQGAMAKQRNLLSALCREISLLDQIVVLASHLKAAPIKHKMEIYKTVKDEALSFILQIRDKVQYSSTDYKTNRSGGQVWKAVALLEKTLGQNPYWDIDKLILAKLLDHIVRLNTWAADRQEHIRYKIHPLKWFFLECLGFSSFFGILVLQAKSYFMELSMATLTAFSISILCYVVADLDSPFTGFFKVNISAIVEIIDKSEEMYYDTLMNKDPYQLRIKAITKNIGPPGHLECVNEQSICKMPTKTETDEDIEYLLKVENLEGEKENVAVIPNVPDDAQVL